METTVSQLLTGAGFLYQEVAVIERLVTHLSLSVESERSLGNRLLYLRKAAHQWLGEESITLFLTLSSVERDTLCVVTQNVTPIAKLKLNAMIETA